MYEVALFLYKGENMKINNKIKIILLIILIFINILSCDLKKEKNDKDTLKKEYNNQDIFKDLPLEKVRERFDIMSKKNKIKLKKFERLNYDGKSFYYSEVVNNERTSYTIEYIGIDVRGLFFKVNSINAENLFVIQNFIINLIVICFVMWFTFTIKKAEANAIYEELLEKMQQGELFSKTDYKNGIIYGLQIDSQKGELIFFAQ